MDVDEKRFAEMITWAMCRMAGGAGYGKCDPERCVCGVEGRTVAAEVYGNGYVLTERGEGTVMVTARKAAGRVEGWSPAKRDAARRIIRGNS